MPLSQSGSLLALCHKLKLTMVAFGNLTLSICFAAGALGDRATQYLRDAHGHTRVFACFVRLRDAVGPVPNKQLDLGTPPPPLVPPLLPGPSLLPKVAQLPVSPSTAGCGRRTTGGNGTWLAGGAEVSSRRRALIPAGARAMPERWGRAAA